MSKVDARSGLKAAGLWTLVEFAIRNGLLAVAGGGLVLLLGRRPTDPELEPFVGIGVAVPLLLALLALAAIFRRQTIRERLGPDDLGYRFGWGRVLAGLASGALLFLTAWAASYVDQALFPDWAARAELLIRLMARAGPAVTAIMLVANGVLAPLVEECAWRGYIQYRLTRAWGAWAGLVAPAVLFAAKHVVVDVSFGRTTSLLVGSFGLGLIRHRWGTVASTAAHLTVNLFVTSYAFVAFGH